MITIRSRLEIDSMKKGGKILKDVLDLVRDNAKAGITTRRLDAIAYDYIKRQNASPSFLGYNGFPATLCTSIDSEIVHGIPSGRVLEEGMLLKIDAGVCFNGMHTDAARTFAIGRISPDKAALMRVCEESFYKGIGVLKDGARLGDLGNAIQEYAEANGFSVVRELVGHGIGRNVHEDPNVPNYGVKGRGTRLVTNMALAVEPMINLGTRHIQTQEDGWTISTLDGSPSAHYENTVIVCENGVEILTV